MPNLSEEYFRSIIIANKHNPYANLVPFYLQVGFPEIFYNSFIPKQKEFIMYAAPVAVYKDKERVVGYKGGYVGYTARLFKGFSIHQGSSRGVPVRKNIRKFINGDLIATNQRVVFISDEEGFEIKSENIISLKLTSKHSFNIQTARYTKRIYVKETEVLKYLYMMISQAWQTDDNGLDYYEHYLQSKDLRTPEIQKKCDRLTKKVKRYGFFVKSVKHSILKKLFIWLIVIIGIIVIIDNKQNNKEQISLKKELVQTEIPSKRIPEQAEPILRPVATNVYEKNLSKTEGALVQQCDRLINSLKQAGFTITDRDIENFPYKCGFSIKNPTSRYLYLELYGKNGISTTLRVLKPNSISRVFLYKSQIDTIGGEIIKINFKTRI